MAVLDVGHGQEPGVPGRRPTSEAAAGRQVTALFVQGRPFPLFFGRPGRLDWFAVAIEQLQFRRPGGGRGRNGRLIVVDAVRPLLLPILTVRFGNDLRDGTAATAVVGRLRRLFAADGRRRGRRLLAGRRVERVLQLQVHPAQLFLQAPPRVAGPAAVPFGGGRHRFRGRSGRFGCSRRTPSHRLFSGRRRRLQFRGEFGRYQDECFFRLFGGVVREVGRIRRHLRRVHAHRAQRQFAQFFQFLSFVFETLQIRLKW